MDLQHKTTEQHKTQERPWYHTPEAEQPSPSAAASAQEALFESLAAERILARAGALQEVHGQLLSKEQIEAIAADIGIQPEFVRLAMEQEKAGALSEPESAVNQKRVAALTSQSHLAKPQVSATVKGCGLVTAAYAAAYLSGVGGWGIFLLLCALPLLTSFVLGAKRQSRRRGASSGFAIAVSAVTTLLAIWLFQGAGLNSIMFLIFSIVTAGNVLAGVAGAQTRRMVSKRKARHARSAHSR